MNPFGFLRAAAATPLLRVADCAFNIEHILALMRRAESEHVNVLVFPELAITGYTCADLFHHPVLQRGAVETLAQLVKDSAAVFSGLAIVGLPLAV
jgi:NAD+ synthase (glutamine-hydrolysing)